MTNNINKNNKEKDIFQKEKKNQMNKNNGNSKTNYKNNIMNKDMDKKTFLTEANLVEQKSNKIEKSTDTKLDFGQEKKEMQNKIIIQNIKSKSSKKPKKYINKNFILYTLNNRTIKNKSLKIMTNLEKAESAYQLLKIQIDELLSEDDLEDEQEISNQNLQMVEFFNQLNQIVTFISDNNLITFNTSSIFLSGLILLRPSIIEDIN